MDADLEADIGTAGFGSIQAAIDRQKENAGLLMDQDKKYREAKCRVTA